MWCSRGAKGCLQCLFRRGAPSKPLSVSEVCHSYPPTGYFATIWFTKALSSRTSCHACWIAAFKASFLVSSDPSIVSNSGWGSCVRSLRRYQRCSMMLRSGDFGGNLRRFIPISCTQSIISVAVCRLELSQIIVSSPPRQQEFGS
jgi:hypothetical protein